MEKNKAFPADAEERRFAAADAHCDFLYGMVNYGYELARPAKRQAVRLDKLIEGGVKLQFFAAWIDMQLDVNPLCQCTGLIDAYYRMLDSNPRLAPLARDGIPEGRIGTVLTVEGGEAIEANIANIRILHRLGVRAMTLTWNDANRLAYPAADKHSRRGLSRLGKEAVREMCRTGVAVDLAHLNDAGIDDVLSIATRPVFASHSNARALCDHPRCLMDEHIAAIAKQGGVVGVNFFSKQLTGDERAALRDVVRHIEHVASIGGVHAAAIGSDLDGMGKYIPGLETSAGMPLIANELLKLNYSEDDVQAIMFDNLYGYIRQFA